MPAIEVTPTGPVTSSHKYRPDEYNGVISITIAGAVSLLSALSALLIILPRTTLYKRTHILGYFVSLLCSNVIQSSGTVMGVEWLRMGGVHQTPLCVAQAAIKQLGNVGNALWSVSIAMHLFNILFLRWTSRWGGFLGMLVAGWCFLFAVVLVGPAVLQKEAPYFGVSGSWCWITPAYPLEQRFLEYFFEYVSAFCSFFLYTAILLRVRGNLIILPLKKNMPQSSLRRMRLRFVPKGESWRLSLLRDYIDTSMIRVVHQMVWYPVAYSLLIVPISMTRLGDVATIAPWAVLATDVIYNLQGAVNVLLLLGTQRLFPATSDLPPFKPRHTLDLEMIARHGITPFVIDEPKSLTPSTDGKDGKDLDDVSLGSSDDDWPPPPKTVYCRQHPPPGWI